MAKYKRYLLIIFRICSSYFSQTKATRKNLANLPIRETIIKSLLRHAEGHIEKHCANIEIYLTNPAGIGEHPDILEAIEKELAVIAEYEDQISIIRKYFS